MPLPTTLAGRLRLPAIASPMFLVSGTDLVVETCKAGILGTFPALNQRTSEGYAAWLPASGLSTEAQEQINQRGGDRGNWRGGPPGGFGGGHKTVAAFPRAVVAADGAVHVGQPPVTGLQQVLGHVHALSRQGEDMLSHGQVIRQNIEQLIVGLQFQALLPAGFQQLRRFIGHRLGGARIQGQLTVAVLHIAVFGQFDQAAHALHVDPGAAHFQRQVVAGHQVVGAAIHQHRPGAHVVHGRGGGHRDTA